MKRFRFKLEPVLDARRADERQRQREVADIQRDLHGLEEKLRRQQDLIMSGRDQLRERLRGRLQMHDLRSRANASIQAMRIARQLAVQLAGVHQRLNQARERLLEASRQRRAIELLRERRLQEFQAMQRRAEQQVHDELAAAHAYRKER